MLLNFHTKSEMNTSVNQREQERTEKQVTLLMNISYKKVINLIIHTSQYNNNIYIYS